MSSSKTLSYTEQLDRLRNDLHRDVVQTAGLKDVTFNGFYEFREPIETYVMYHNNDRNLIATYVRILGVNWDGNIVAEDGKGRDQHLRYNQLSLEEMSMMLLKLRDEEHYRRVDEESPQDEVTLLNLFGKKIF